LIECGLLVKKQQRDERKMGETPATFGTGLAIVYVTPMRHTTSERSRTRTKQPSNWDTEEV
jgi:hypothetical protein